MKVVCKETNKKDFVKAMLEINTYNAGVRISNNYYAKGCCNACVRVVHVVPDDFFNLHDVYIGWCFLSFTHTAFLCAWLADHSSPIHSGCSAHCASYRKVISYNIFFCQ